MGFRFRKSVRLFPGVRLNISKTGLSTSLGVPGAMVNVRGRRVRGTVGLPGSGLSYSEEATLGSEAEAPVEGEAKPPKTLGLRLMRRLFGEPTGRR
jgi:hypothetical protein